MILRWTSTGIALLIVGLVSPFFWSYRSISIVSHHVSVHSVPMRWNSWGGYKKVLEVDRISELMVPPPKVKGISSGLHYFLFWGAETRLLFNGEEHNLIDALGSGAFDVDGKPAFFTGVDGIVRTANDFGNGEAHPAQTLAYLGELGVPSAAKIRIGHEEIAVSDLVYSAIQTFSLEGEFEWQLAALLHYYDGSEWMNRWGEQFSYDQCADFITSRELGSGPCEGIHALGVCVAMLHVDKSRPILSTRSKDSISRMLLMASARLNQNMCSNGGWNNSWSATEPLHSFEHSRSSTTGHHLEWIAECPVDLRPRAEVIRRAIQAGHTQVKETNPEDCHKNLCAFTHLIKSLYYFRELEEL